MPAHKTRETDDSYGKALQRRPVIACRVFFENVFDAKDVGDQPLNFVITFCCLHGSHHLLFDVTSTQELEAHIPVVYVERETALVAMVND